LVIWLSSLLKPKCNQLWSQILYPLFCLDAIYIIDIGWSKIVVVIWWFLVLNPFKDFFFEWDSVVAYEAHLFINTFLFHVYISIYHQHHYNMTNNLNRHLHPSHLLHFHRGQKQSESFRYLSSSLRRICPNSYSLLQRCFFQ